MIGRWRVVLRLLEAAVVLGVAAFFLVPQVSHAAHSLHTIGGTQVGWLTGAMVAVLLSFVAFSLGTRALLLNEQVALPFPTILRIDLSTIAVSHAVPGGSAVGTALGARLLVARGVPTLISGFVKVTHGVLSQCMLQLLLWGALIFAIPIHGTSPLYVTATAVGVVILAITGSGVALLTWRPDVPAALLRRWGGRVPPPARRTVERALQALPQHLRRLGENRLRLVWICVWSVLNWVLDAVALWFCVRGFGYHLGYVELIVAFGLASVLASFPITPSGLGVVEGVLVPTLVAFGSPSSAAVLGVLGWRLVTFWLPIPLGGAAYVSLMATDRKRPRQPGPSQQPPPATVVIGACVSD